MIDDLRKRLGATRWPREPRDNGDWRYGTSLDYLRELVRAWRDDFDWRRQEAELNRFPQFVVPLTGSDGQVHEIHYLYERGAGKAPTPLILTHGWPSTHREFLDVVEPLAHPERFGGDPDDGFDVVVPSLPGYGFSSQPEIPIGPSEIAELWYVLMTEVIGAQRFAAQAGDWGSVVTSRLAVAHEEALIGLHLTMLPLRADLGHPSQPAVSPEEAEWIAGTKAWWREEDGYRAIQSTKPLTLAYGLTDSPAGLAGWLADKYYRLGDTDKSEPSLGMHARFPLEQILTQLSIYWFTGTIGSASALYKAGSRDAATRLPPGRRLEVPTGFADFPIDTLPRMPRSWAERAYHIVHWSLMERGGHFAAMEEPELFVDDVREFFGHLASNHRKSDRP
jgi:pimeloyl-ACP methyl ester carboxylesterase